MMLLENSHPCFHWDLLNQIWVGSEGSRSGSRTGASGFSGGFGGSLIGGGIGSAGVPRL
jgi:hypothetical protein